MTLHMMWLWFWFFVGTALYWLKRAYYLITGPNPIANTWKQFLQRCWPPLLVRAAFGSVVYWCLFSPQVTVAGLGYLGWTKFATTIAILIQFAPVAWMAGFFVDSGLDIFLSKTPGLKDALPQMPAPLPKAEVANPPAPQDRKAEGI